MATDSALTSPLTPHPAKYGIEIKRYLEGLAREARVVLDPFAGVGGAGVGWLYNELEWEWASQGPRGRVAVGDALRLAVRRESVDIVCTSPVYGNRMSDHHNARDASQRITYRHKLGRPLSANNAGQLQWGRAYKQFHIRAWCEVRRVLKVGGVFALNVGDHYRKGELQYVSWWHLETCAGLGFKWEKIAWIETPGMRWGQNGQKRMGGEYVIVMRKVSTI